MRDSVLIVDDDETMCHVLEDGLSRLGYEACSCTSSDAAIELLNRRPFDVVISDIQMEGTDGLALCRTIVQEHPDVPVIVITAFGSVESAVAAIRAGAHDFVSKPFELRDLYRRLVAATQHRRLTRRVERLEQASLQKLGPEGPLGSSRAIRQVYELVARVAASDATVLITGESGTGKELVARALHRQGHRASGPFVAINCAAVPESLLESELFGHKKGAFTDARGDRRGLFVEANGGTLFLDEIAEMPLSLQSKLLRALEDKRVRPLGGNAEVVFDTRIVAATNQNLERAVAEGRFRQDLYYRIYVVNIEVPPLRARRDDILILAQHFVRELAPASGKRVTGILGSAADMLVSYPWPGNVRELRNCIEHAVTLCRYSRISVADLPDRVRRASRSAEVVAEMGANELPTIGELESSYLARVFAVTRGNKALAAKILGLNEKTLSRKLRRHGLLPPHAGDGA